MQHSLSAVKTEIALIHKSIRFESHTDRPSIAKTKNHSKIIRRTIGNIVRDVINCKWAIRYYLITYTVYQTIKRYIYQFERFDCTTGRDKILIHACVL